MPALHSNELAMLLELSEGLGSPLNLRASFVDAALAKGSRAAS
jgi:hypothetical protein